MNIENKFTNSRSFTASDGTPVEEIKYDDIKDFYHDDISKFTSIGKIKMAGDTVKEVADNIDSFAIKIKTKDKDDYEKEKANDEMNNRKIKRDKMINIIILSLTIIYLISPVDLFPEGIFPLIGYIDDFLLMLYAISRVF